MIPKARTPGRPKSIAGTFASSVRNDDPDVTKAQIDKKRREKKKREKWVTVGKEMKIQLNVDLLARYHDLCENVDNKFGAIAALEKATQNDGQLVSEYHSKYGVGRRYSKGPSPQRMDVNSRGVSMYGLEYSDGDQENSAPKIAKFFGKVLAMSDATIAHVD